jgi:hypothetical protein
MAAATAITVNAAAPGIADAFSHLFRVTATLDSANNADAAGITDTVAVPGVALGDIVLGFSFGVDLAGNTVTAYVSAANVVSIRVQNESGGAVDLASTTIRLLIGRPVF